MTIALVQHAIHGSAGNSNVATFPGAATAGNLIIASVTWGAATGTCSITDTHGDAMTPISSPIVAGGQSKQSFLIPNIVGGGTDVTATFSGAGSGSTIEISEWSGAQTTTSMDSGNLANMASANGTGTAAASQSMTPSIDNCLIYGWLACDTGSTTITGAGGYTLLDQDAYGNAAVYRIQTTAAATQAASTIDTSVNWYQSGVIIRPSGSSAKLPPMLLHTQVVR